MLLLDLIAYTVYGGLGCVLFRFTWYLGVEVSGLTMRRFEFSGLR